MLSPNGEGLTECMSHAPTIGRAAILDRPSITELSELTSDSILTADRRGGILISFGPDRRPFGVLNPSNRLCRSVPGMG